tara:strand:+ start:139 stop:1359 length:1221 start_codon:yes stop_codon:yes gene_type:complete
MINFKKFITEQKNTHMTHIEDAVIHGGVNGTRQAIMGLRGLRDMLQGTHKGGLSVKWDGAPAVFAGIDPSDQQFFVAKKGIFNKNPMVYKTKADVDADTSGELNVKLNEALLYLPQLGIKNVLQGDFLYSASDVKTKKIDGQDYVTFHPNTIVYAVPVGSDMAKDILKSKIGIVWHTSYSGTTFESMKAKFGADVSKLSKSKDVWSQDAMLKDITQATLSAADTQIVNERLSAIGTLFNKISGNVLKELGSNPALSQQIETFNNSFVRDGEIVKDTKKHTEALVKYIYNKFQKEIDKRKTSKGKDAQASKRDEFLKFFSADNKKNLKLIFDLQKLIVEAKLILIAKLNELNDINTFVKTSKGYKVTGQEGYVAIDTLTGGALKVVDRMEFSFNNFSPSVIKGWQKV